MALRLILMGVVAGMGMSLPNPDDVVGWCGAAASWVDARFLGLEEPTPPVETDVVLMDETTPAETPAQMPSDEQFNAVMSDMATAFAKEMTPATTEPSVVRIVEAPAAPPVEVIPPAKPAKAAEPANEEKVAVIDPDATFNLVMNETVGAFKADLATLPHDEPAEVVATAEAVETPTIDPLPLEAPAAQVASTTDATASTPASEPSKEVQEGHPDRLEHAMRLTREAVFAWASLIHGPAVVTIPH